MNDTKNRPLSIAGIVVSLAISFSAHAGDDEAAKKCREALMPERQAIAANAQELNQAVQEFNLRKHELSDAEQKSQTQEYRAKFSDIRVRTAKLKENWNGCQTAGKSQSDNPKQ